MERDRFLSEVEDSAELDDNQAAEQATEAVLGTLGERVVGGEADDLASQLPSGVGVALTGGDGGEQFDFDGFTDRVADRLDADASPKRVSQAVASVLVDATSKGELRDLVSEFPKNEGYGELLALADEGAS